jgi:hypothetical protein
MKEGAMMNEPPSNDIRQVWQNQSVEAIQMSLDEIRNKAQKFQRRVHWSNLREYLAAVFVVAIFGFYFWRFDGILLRTGSALVIAGTLYVMYQLYKRGSAKTVPADLASRTCLDFHRRELERQRDLLRDVWRWYLLPFVPGMVVFFAGGAIELPLGRWGPLGITVALCAIVFFLIGKLNHWAARKLQHQIDGLDALENDVPRTPPERSPSL